MLSVVHSAGFSKATPHLVDVEVEVSNTGLPYTSLVGLPSTEVRESKERVRSALRQTGLRIRAKKTVINLSPASLPKEGPSFDAAIALGILQANAMIPAISPSTLVVGELSLEGQMKHVERVAALVLLARKEGYKEVILPKDNIPEATHIHGIVVRGAKTLQEVISHITHAAPIPESPLSPYTPQRLPAEQVPYLSGQSLAKRAAAVAAAGGHHLFVFGSPGRGKTLLASFLQYLLPPLQQAEFEEVIAANSEHLQQVHQGIPPIRAVTPAVSASALFGSLHRQSEIARAAHGILFMDEFLEYQLAALNTLKILLEQRPSFLLYAAANPCICGKRYSLTQRCSCSAADILRYTKKLKHPVMERIDMHVFMQDEHFSVEKSENTHDDMRAEEIEMLQHIDKARNKQRERFQQDFLTNASMTSKDIRERCSLSRQARAVLNAYGDRNHLSPRRYVCVARTAQTLADMEGSETIERPHMTEAIGLCVLPE